MYCIGDVHGCAGLLDDLHRMIRMDAEGYDGVTQVLYLGDQEVDDRSEIFRVPIDGSAAPVKLSGPLVAAGDVGEMLISPDGLVVYWADQELDGRFELYSVPADGTASPIKLSGALAPGGDVLFGSRITPDGDRVLYLARGQIPNPVGTLALYSVPIDASAPSVELVELDPSGNIAEYAISEDGTVVAGHQGNQPVWINEPALWRCPS